MKGCFKDKVTPAYYGNVGNLADYNDEEVF